MTSSSLIQQYTKETYVFPFTKNTLPWSLIHANFYKIFHQMIRNISQAQSRENQTSYSNHKIWKYQIVMFFGSLFKCDDKLHKIFEPIRDHLHPDVNLQWNPELVKLIHTVNFSIS